MATSIQTTYWEEKFNNKGQKYYYNTETKQSEWTRPNMPVALSVSSPPHPDDPIWIVRISQRRGAENARNDYKILKYALYSQADDWTKLGVWDKDTKNRMKPNSWLGFIIGEVGSEVVELFYIEKEDSTGVRPEHWCTETDYTDQETTSVPNTRETVIFKKQDIIRMSWAEWKQRAGYSEKYTPRGTTISKSPY